MPLYEYLCEECGESFDRLSPAAEADEAACPSCGAARTRRLFSVIAGMGGRREQEAPVCGRGACAACS